MSVDELTKRRFENAAALAETDPEKAAVLVHELHTQHPSHAGISGYLGLLLNGLGRYEEAAAAFERTLELSPRSVAAYRGLFLALWDLKRPQEALQILQRGAKETGAGELVELREQVESSLRDD